MVAQLFDSSYRDSKKNYTKDLKRNLEWDKISLERGSVQIGLKESGLMAFGSFFFAKV